MNRNKELAKNTIILTFGKICTQFISFLLLPLYTSLLAPSEYGVLDLLTSYSTLLIPLFNWQFDNGLFRFLIDCRSDKKQQIVVFSTVFFTNLVQSLFYCVLFLIIQEYVNIEYKKFLLFDVLLSIFLNTLLQFARGVGKNLTYTIGSFVSASMTVILNVIFIVFLSFGVKGMFSATIIAKIITIMYLIWSQRIWQYIKSDCFSIKMFKAIFRYSFPLVPNQLSWWVMNVSDRTIISTFLGITVNGIYSVANKFSSIFITFYNIFNLAWTESVSLHINDDDRDYFLTTTINIMFNLFSTICLSIIIVMPIEFPIMVDKSYDVAYNHIPILLIGALFQVIVGLYSVIYAAKKDSKAIAKTSMMSAIINIVLNLVFIKFIGLYAASFSTMIAYGTMAIYRYHHVRKYAIIKLRKKNLIMICSSFIIALIFYYLRITNLFSTIIAYALLVIYTLFMNKKIIFSFVNNIKKKEGK